MKTVNPYTKFFSEDLTPIDGDVGNAFWSYHVANNFGRILGIDGTINFGTARNTNIVTATTQTYYDVPIGQLALTNPPVIVAYATQHGTSGGYSSWPVCLEAYADFEKVRFKWMSESRGDVYFKIFGNADITQSAATVDRSAIIPQTGDTLGTTWVQRLAQQQERALGFWGSSILSLNVNISDTSISVTTPTITLPPTYGTKMPPMIFAVARYGSVAIYKSLIDKAGLVGRYTNGIFPNTFPYEPYFHTYVHNLVVAHGEWSFRITHKTNLLVSLSGIPIPGNLVNAPVFTAPYRPIGLDQWTLPVAYWVDPLNKVAIHWHVLGVDTSIGAT